MAVKPKEDILIPWHFKGYNNPRELPKAIYYIDVQQALESTLSLQLKMQLNKLKAKYYATLVIAGITIILLCKIIYDLT